MRQTSTAALILTALLGLANTAAAQTQIWLSPMSNVTPDKRGAADYNRFALDPPSWANIAPRTSVFKIYPYFAGRAPEADLKALFTILKSSHIALALEGRALSHVHGCKMIDGDGGENTVHQLNRLKRLGGEVTYLAMDEPLKHVTAGVKSCQPTLMEAAQDVADNVRQFRQIFPNLKVGDIEPIGTWAHTETLLANTLDWAKAYQQAVGEPLAFVHADVGWGTDWVGICASLQRDLTKMGIPFGMIYNGSDLATSAREWTAQAREHFQKFEDGRRPPPAMAVIQSWVTYPERALPETDSESLTGVELDYLRFHGLPRTNSGTH